MDSTWRTACLVVFSVSLFGGIVAGENGNYVLGLFLFILAILDILFVVFYSKHAHSIKNGKFKFKKGSNLFILLLTLFLLFAFVWLWVKLVVEFKFIFIFVILLGLMIFFLATSKVNFASNSDDYLPDPEPITETHIENILSQGEGSLVPIKQVYVREHIRHTSTGKSVVVKSHTKDIPDFKNGIEF